MFCAIPSIEAIEQTKASQDDEFVFSGDRERALGSRDREAAERAMQHAVIAYLKDALFERDGPNLAISRYEHTIKSFRDWYRAENRYSQSFYGRWAKISSNYDITSLSDVGRHDSAADRE
jgi:hypothetical protein